MSKVEKTNRFKGLMQVIRQDVSIMEAVTAPINVASSDPLAPASEAPSPEDLESEAPNIKDSAASGDESVISLRGSAQPAPITVQLHKIYRDPDQDRRYFDLTELENMAASIKKVGVIDPLSVRLYPGQRDEFDLLAGEKRHRAAKMAGLEVVPVRIFEIDDDTAADIKSISNLQRSDLSKWEETSAIMNMLCRHLGVEPEEVVSILNQLANQKRGLTSNVVRSEDLEIVQEVFAVAGRLTPESFRKHRLPLLKLPIHIQEVLKEGKLHYTKVNEVLRVKDTEQQRQLLEQAIAQKLSMDAIQTQVRALRQSDSNGSATPNQTLLTQFKGLPQRLKQARILEDAKKRERLIKLLGQIEELMY